MPGAATVRRESLREYARRRIAVDLQSGIVHHVEPDLQGQPPQVQRPQGLFSDSQFEIDRHFKVDRQFESDVCTRLPTTYQPPTCYSSLQRRPCLSQFAEKSLPIAQVGRHLGRR